MTCQDRLSQWETEVSTAFAHLSKAQIWGLVCWSAGIALAGCAGITQISALLALVLCQGEQTVGSRAYVSGIWMQTKKVGTSGVNER